MSKRAVILLSGGLDSATVLAIAKSQGFECHTLGFDYGQRHSHELACAKLLSPNHRIVRIDNFGSSALVDKNIEVPKALPHPNPLLIGEGVTIHPSYQEGKHFLHPSYQEGMGEVPERRPYNPDNLDKAKSLRTNSTEAEKLLWRKLRNRQLNNLKFRRQEPLGNYIVDFLCVENKLVIELDGGQHASQQEYDSIRDKYFRENGYGILRFWNNDVLQNPDGVLQTIRQALPHPDPLLKGEGARQEIPVTYVPARNTIFLSFALAYAEVLGANDIFIGVNALDYSGYPDCRPEYIESFGKMANLATKRGVEGEKLILHAPLINLTKAEIIKLGVSLGVDYSQTSSCYDPVDGEACGACDSCRLRLKGFSEAGIEDPARYV